MLLTGAGILAAAAASEGPVPVDPEHGELPLYARADFGLASVVSAGSALVNSDLHAAERRLGARLPLVGRFINFDTRWSDKQPVWDALSAEGRTLALAWGPARHGQTVLLSDVAEGRYQEHVDQVLSGVAAYGQPVVCRWGWEMNGNWSEYSAAYQGEKRGCTDPAEYVAAWQYMVGRARALEVSNLRWLFCPNGSDVGGYTMEQYWPGAEFVDLVGADAYNGFAEWTSFHDLFVQPYQRLMRLGSNSEFWVGETGCVESSTSGVSKAEWARQMFHETRLPLLRAVNYFDDYGSRDWRIQTSPSSERAFAAGFQLAE